MASITKRVGRAGRVTWGVRVRINGYATLSKSFPTKLEAQRWAYLTEAAARGRTLAVSRDATLADLIDEYSPKARNSTRPMLRYWRASLGNLRLRDVADLRIDRFNLSLHVGGTAPLDTRKWYDNVVAATSYIGHMARP